MHDIPLQCNVSKTVWIIFAFSAAYIKKSDPSIRNQYYPFAVIDCSEMEDNFHCATSIFSPALFSSFTWLFAIIIIFRHLPRENPPHVFLPCILVAQPRSTRWMDYAENGRKKHREESKVLKRSSRWWWRRKSREIEKLIESIISVITPLRISVCFESYFSPSFKIRKNMQTDNMPLWIHFNTYMWS